MNFKQFLTEHKNSWETIQLELSNMPPEEIDEFGEFLDYTFFGELDDDFGDFEDSGELDDDSDDSDEFEYSMSDVLHLVDLLGVSMFPEIVRLLGVSDDIDDIDDIDERVSRIMKVSNRNRKKRKFMQNTKADLRRTTQLRKRKARSNKAKTKHYRSVNKNKIKAYQKSRSDAIKSGKHVVKKRRVA